MDFNTFLLKSKLSLAKNVQLKGKKIKGKLAIFWEKCYKVWMISVNASQSHPSYS